MFLQSLKAEALLVSKHTERDIAGVVKCGDHCKKENYIMGNGNGCIH